MNLSLSVLLFSQENCHYKNSQHRASWHLTHKTIGFMERIPAAALSNNLKTELEKKKKTNKKMDLSVRCGRWREINLWSSSWTSNNITDQWKSKLKSYYSCTYRQHLNQHLFLWDNVNTPISTRRLILPHSFQIWYLAQSLLKVFPNFIHQM